VSSDHGGKRCFCCTARMWRCKRPPPSTVQETEIQDLEELLQKTNRSELVDRLRRKWDSEYENPESPTRPSPLIMQGATNKIVVHEPDGLPQRLPMDESLYGVNGTATTATSALDLEQDQNRHQQSPERTPARPERGDVDYAAEGDCAESDKLQLERRLDFNPDSMSPQTPRATKSVSCPVLEEWSTMLAVQTADASRADDEKFVPVDVEEEPEMTSMVMSALVNPDVPVCGKGDVPVQSVPDVADTVDAFDRDGTVIGAGAVRICVMSDHGSATVTSVSASGSQQPQPEEGGSACPEVAAAKVILAVATAASTLGKPGLGQQQGVEPPKAHMSDSSTHHNGEDETDEDSDNLGRGVNNTESGMAAPAKEWSRHSRCPVPLAQVSSRSASLRIKQQSLSPLQLPVPTTNQASDLNSDSRRRSNRFRMSNMWCSAAETLSPRAFHRSRNCEHGANSPKRVLVRSISLPGKTFSDMSTASAAVSKANSGGRGKKRIAAKQGDASPRDQSTWPEKHCNQRNSEESNNTAGEQEIGVPGEREEQLPREWELQMAPEPCVEDRLSLSASKVDAAGRARAASASLECEHNSAGKEDMSAGSKFLLAGSNEERGATCIELLCKESSTERDEVNTVFSDEYEASSQRR